jgi:hypothetical protein
LKDEIEDITYPFKKKELERKLNYFKIVNQMSQGMAFGELALSTDNTVNERAATTVSLEETILAVMEKEDYLKILQVIENERL